ncbi:unnamed protein product [Ostreobium quekettii]|uniref:Uncharacterized protein n=1 Tax=Ostreobium quekettii TaxID=121088 RepID=A0A8S1J3R4_9CHLO|nr:unnamed protein product [Ostreobium quekettii]
MDCAAGPLRRAAGAAGEAGCRGELFTVAKGRRAGTRTRAPAGALRRRAWGAARRQRSQGTIWGGIGDAMLTGCIQGAAGGNGLAQGGHRREGFARVGSSRWISIGASSGDSPATDGQRRRTRVSRKSKKRGANNDTFTASGAPKGPPEVPCTEERPASASPTAAGAQSAAPKSVSRKALVIDPRGDADRPTGIRPELLRFLQSSLGINPGDAADMVRRAIDWWRDVGSQREGRRALHPGDFNERHAEASLLFLAGRGVAVKDLRGIVSRCPELLDADVKDLSPLIGLLEGLKIKGRALGKVLAGHPEVMLQGDWRTIAKVVEVLRRLGVHEDQVRHTVAAFPPLLCIRIEDLRDNSYALADLIVKEDDLVPLVAKHPSLLNHPRQAFEAVCKALAPGGVEEAQVRAMIQKEPRILVKTVGTMEAIVKHFLEGGLSKVELGALLSKDPKLLLCRYATIQSKTHFLMHVVKRPISDVMSFPAYYYYSLSRRIGPRFMFLSRRMEKPAVDSLGLQDILQCDDDTFAEELVGALFEEYKVFQAQWQRLQGARLPIIRGREPKHRNGGGAIEAMVRMDQKKLSI